ncbi:hypothetical protein, partial [Streptococcus anginosus]|uniref:hypothetical protein n=1 Tax=Streptococcus anginosus TaxID=1328 RepID=UPI002ED7AEE0
LDILFPYLSSVILLTSASMRKPPNPASLPWHSPTLGIEPSKEQRLLLSLMTENVQLLVHKQLSMGHSLCTLWLVV